MLKNFLTTHTTEPPLISTFWHGLMLMFILLFIYVAVKYHDNSYIVETFKWIQIIQLVVLYTWYIGFRLPLANSLPLYHCRLAMLAVVFLPDNWRIKQYFALMGVSGAVFALGYPVFDPYDFPHITSFSFLIGHYALLGNSLVYLMNSYDKKALKKYQILFYTFALDLFLVGINHLTGGNYGLMTHPPFIKGENILFNYLVVSTILSVTLILLDEIFKRRWKKKSKIISN